MIKPTRYRFATLQKERKESVPCEETTVIPGRTAHLQTRDGHNRPRVARWKEAREMELVLTILVVTLLIILPALFLVLMVGGLIYALYRALVGTKEKGGAPRLRARQPGRPAQLNSPQKISLPITPTVSREGG